MQQEGDDTTRLIAKTPDTPRTGSSEVHGNLPGPSPSAVQQPRRGSWSRLGPLLLLVCLVNLCWSLYELPLNRIVERRLCHEYYAQHDPSQLGPDGEVREVLCKINEVEKRLGWIQGVAQTMWVAGDFIVTIPLTSLVDRYGYRPILWLNIVPRVIALLWSSFVGASTTLPAEAFLVSPIASLLGGECVFNSIIYSLVTSLTDDHIERATFFAKINAASSIFALQLGPAFASAAMDLKLWAPLWIGTALLLCCIPLITHLKPASSGGERSHRAAPTERHGLLSRRPHYIPTLSVKAQLHSAKAMLAAVPGNFYLLLLSFFLSSLASSDTKLLPQYISKRYAWRYASVGYLLSAKAGFSFVVVFLLLPALLQLEYRDAAQESSPDNLNKRYAILCLLISIVGALAIGVSPDIGFLIPSLLTYGLGSALPVFTYSLLKSPAVLSSHLALSQGPLVTDSRAFSIVMTVKTAGSLIGVPLMTTLWIHGIGGGLPIGSPYFTSALFYTAAAFVIWKIAFHTRHVT